MKSFTSSVIYISNKCKEYSYGSKRDFKSILIQCAQDLHSMGYKVSHIKGIKHKHIYKLIEHWNKKNLNPGTIKNRMSKLRKLDFVLCGQIGIKRENGNYKIEQRNYSSETTKAIDLPCLKNYKDPYLKLSIEGQRLFGLRREESIKIIISEAIINNKLALQPSWTKGGIGREIPIKSEEQHNWVKNVFRVTNLGCSLIPMNKTYKQQLDIYNSETKKNKDKNLHGLRHAYAQERYREITKVLDPKKKGLKCPHESGIQRKDLSQEDLYTDTRARHILSREMGHSRVSIMKIYLG